MPNCRAWAAAGRGLGGVAGDEEDIGIGGLNLGQFRFKVPGAPVEGLGGHHLDAVLLEELAEEPGAALAVGFVGEKDGHGLGFPGLGHVIRQDFGLFVDAGAAPVKVGAVAAQLAGWWRWG